MSSEEAAAQKLAISVIAAHAGSVLFARAFTAVASIFGYQGLTSNGLAVLKDACANKPEAVAVSEEFFSEPQTAPSGAMVAPGLGDSVPASANVGVKSIGWAFAGDVGDAPTRHTFVFPQFPFLHNNKRSPPLPEEYQVRVDVPRQVAHISVWTRFRTFRGGKGMKVNDYLSILAVKDQFNAFSVSSDTAPTVTSLLAYALYRVRNISQEYPGSIRWSGDPTLVSPVPQNAGWLYYLSNNIVPVLSRTNFNSRGGEGSLLPSSQESFHYLTAVPKYEPISANADKSMQEILYAAVVPETLKLSWTSGRLTPRSESTGKSLWTRFSVTIPFPKFRSDVPSQFVASPEPVIASLTAGRNLHPSLSSAVSLDFDTKNGFASGIRIVHNPENMAIPSTSISVHSRRGAAARFTFALGPLRTFVAGGLTHQGSNRFVVPKYGAGFALDI